MVNPPRDEIRRIRAQLLEYGQVGDANVFYWFQNRKSRSKHKQRTLQAKMNATALSGNRSGTQNSPSLPASSSSSSSDKASPQKAGATLSGSAGGAGSSSYGSGSSGNNYNTSSGNVVVDQFGNSPTSVNQPSPYFHPLVPHPPHHNHVPNTNTTSTTTTTCIQDQTLFFPLHQNGATVMGNFSQQQQQGLCFGTTNTHDHHYEDHHPHLHPHPLHQINLDVPHHSDQTVGGFSSLLLGDDEVEKLKFQHQLSLLVTNPSTASTNSPSHAYAFPNSVAQILGNYIP